MSGETGRAQGHSFTLVQWALKRKVTVLVLLLAILVLGVVSTAGIPLELIPRGYTNPSLQVLVPWRDAPTEEVLEKIGLPVEEELASVGGLDGMYTMARLGFCQISLSFKTGTDMDVAYREVRDRIQRVRSTLPTDVDRIYLRKEDSSGVPVAVLGLIIETDQADTYDLIQKEIVQPMQRLDGVASVRTDGLEEKEVIIELDRAATEAAGLNIYDLASQLSGDNFSLASGKVVEGGRRFLLRGKATYQTLEELRNRPLSSTTRLRDVAEVLYEEPDKIYSVRVNSRPAVAVVIFKEGEANTVAVSQRINQLIAAMGANPRLEGFVIEPLFVQGDLIRESLTTLTNNGYMGGALAMIVLFFFLRRFRLTLIITLAIPTSLLVALASMFFLGETLNMLSMLALFIVVGMLVDNAVVVAENIHRFHRSGLSRVQACIQGTREVALAITLATLTSVVVFLPVSLIQGQAQFLLQRLAIPITIALLASLLVALIFIPLAVFLTLPSAERQAHPTAFMKAHEHLHATLRRLYEASMGRLNRVYVRALRWAIPRRLLFGYLLLAAFAGTLAVTRNSLAITLVDEETSQGFELSVELSNEYSFEDTKAFFAELEEILAERKDAFGLEGYFALCLARSGRIEGWFPEDREGGPSAKEITQTLLKLFPERPGIRYFVGRQNQMAREKSDDVFTVALEGEDARQLAEWGRKIAPRFLEIPGVIGQKLSEESEPNEIALLVDRERASSLSIPPLWIASVVSYALRGSSLPRFNQEGREIPVRVRFRKQDRERLQQLGDFTVPTPEGEALPLHALTQTRMLNSTQVLFRRDKKATYELVFNLADGERAATRQALMAMEARIDLPEGMSFSRSGQVSLDPDQKALLMALALSLVFIYLLMAFLFESMILPLSILSTIPLSLFGVAWAHFFAGIQVDLLGAVGLVLLGGVVVNNGIVLVDYVNRLRQDGMARPQALLEAADRRFRPIAMTALTTIIGMLPLAVSRPSSVGLSYRSFGLTLIGGMTTSTLLTLLVVPLLYTLFDDLSQQWRRWKRAEPWAAQRATSAQP